MDIITEYYSVIESKKTDAISMKKKITEWLKIAEEFSTVSSTYARDCLSLKTLWDNLKRKEKLVMAAQSDNQYGTGGKAKYIIADPILDIVVGLIRPHVEPFNNIYDDNYEEISEVIINTIDKELDNNEEEVVTNQKNIDDIEQSISTDWSHYNPSMLKTPISATLRQSPLPTFQSQKQTSRLPSLQNIYFYT
ncbi:uncharacterized protein LOC126906544 [Daktulosphaira vitifoliae]|uniref:uncharacterized protein LOC126906544 n=1 Tax=Daktulosphaira vitifoliae TaxID=58002 RepID=UPI0021AAD5D6|nr:uncharacterized protein LOC126906544 [Daktulosphaira vitifoliae]